MYKSVRRFLSLLLVLQLIIPYSTFAAATGEFKSVVGEVTQTRAKEVIKPVVKSPIQPKDIIITNKASSAMMVFPDSSMIKLEQNSKLEINEFLFKEKSRTAIFFLSIGKVAVNVSKFIGGDNVYEVHSPTATVGVRGTGFEFIESKDGDKTTATVTCTEGSLTISALSPIGVIIATSVIEAGQTAVISGGVITVGAAAGLSTVAIVGITAGAIAGAGAIAAVAGSGGGGGGSTPAPTPAPTPEPTPTPTPISTYSWTSWAEPPDPAPGQNVVVYVSVVSANVSVNYNVSGTDGYHDQGTKTSDSSGKIYFSIPGAEKGVVDTVTVSVPSWGSQYTKTWAYTF